MTSLMVGILVFTATVTIGWALAGLLTPSPGALRSRVAAQTAEMPGPASRTRRILNGAGQFGERLLGRRHKTGTHTPALTRVGFYDQRAPAIYYGAKMLLMALGAAAALLMLTPTDAPPSTVAVVTLLSGGLMFVMPNYYLLQRHSKRQNRVRRFLPDVVDLLEVCVSSGMGLETAWRLIGDEFRCVDPVMADEMMLTNLEVHLGASRQEAIRHMTTRVEVEEVNSFATLVAQSEKFGTSISDALRVFAESTREERSQEAEEKGEKVAVKLLLPMVLFVFPAVAVVLAGPGVIRIASALAEAA
ncbi:MAG: type II secretion system F family protein [Planctomycetota bacterium]